MIPFDLPVAPLKIGLEVLEPIVLPAFAGSKLEGAFGRTLYRLSCTRTDLETCQPCPLRAVCPYGVLYAPSRPAHLPVASLDAPPRPLVFHTTHERKRQLEPGAHFGFGLTLVGHAIENLPYVIASIRAMGELGISQTRGRYRVLEVRALQPYTNEQRTISRGEDPVVRPELFRLNAGDLPNLPSTGVTLEFESFVHLRSGGEMAQHLHFPVLVRALQRRLSNLEQLYGGSRSAGADYSTLPRLARDVDTILHKLRPAGQLRSGKGRAPVMMHGLIGRVSYTGDLTPFTTLLRYGELLGVGKWAHFGAGLYRIQYLQHCEEERA